MHPPDGDNISLWVLPERPETYIRTEISHFPDALVRFAIIRQSGIHLNRSARRTNLRTPLPGSIRTSPVTTHELLLTRITKINGANIQRTTEIQADARQ